MDHSPIIRFRLDRDIAEQAYRMAAEQDMELPDVMRMMVIQAVHRGYFAIGTNRDPSAETDTVSRPREAYEPRYWSDAMPALDAETALAALHLAIAERTAQLDDSLSLTQSDPKRLEQIRDERDTACALLAAFDPEDAAPIATILTRFAPDPLPGSSSGAMP